MANTAHFVRRQSSRDLNPQRSLDKLELKEMRGRLVMENANGGGYGATNAAFEDTSPGAKVKSNYSSKRGSQDGKAIFRPESGEEERESWDSKLTFLLATIGYAVGLGNVWRFPYLAQKNGGGAFLIPYFVMLAIEGIPIFYLELAIGQRLRKGAIGVWNQVSPFLSGIGISSAVVSFNVALYYNTIIAWCLFYFVQSFQSQLPWADCPNVYFPNGSYTTEPECVVSSPTQYFWYRTTLIVSEDINHPETFNWKIALALLVAWILVYMCMIKGIASSGKVVYVTATFPYIVLIIFFFRGITLKGAGDGLRHTLHPSLAHHPGPGAFSSYNPVNNNCYRDAVMVSMTNCFTSMFAGIVVFSIIGFKATMTFEKCLEARDALLADLLGSGYNETALPAEGSVFNITTASGLVSKIMPSLPVCDLQKELDNLTKLCTLEYDYLLLPEINIALLPPINSVEDLTHEDSGDEEYLNINTLPGSQLLALAEIIIKDTDVNEVTGSVSGSASGTGLAFIIFTEAINQFPGAQFWSVLFFLMLFTLGIDSQFGTLEGVVTSVVDMKLFPNLPKEILTGCICLVCCILSMGFAHGAGSYVFVLFDNFSGNFPLLIIAFFECIGVAYVYGLKRFADDIEMMTGQRPGLYWLICWKYLSPLAMLSIMFASFVEIAVDGTGYDAWVPLRGETERHPWPLWAILLILTLILASVLWIPGTAIARLFGIVVIDDNEKAWFPANDLKEFHGIMPHEVTAAETLLFCIRADGSEGLCCPTSHSYDEDDEET
ncbi:hypothetical protein NQ318_016286 [Aromia moschata]|uniref:Transporter n=1 Tax=Aromia moschata TaxID=1265417 RepID=A0AAV8XXA9_9CUCU|nr:hypothetical protein NQ318_016286 [Aromia moschata]